MTTSAHRMTTYRERRCQHCDSLGFWIASDKRGQPICTSCLQRLYVDPLQAAKTGEDAQATKGTGI